METKKMYKWVCDGDHGSFTDESKKSFESKEDCYNDMRNAALNKMKWNTEYKEDFVDLGKEDSNVIGYKVYFSQNKIIHESYSGEYVYEIVEVNTQTNNPMTNNTTTKIVYVLPIGENEVYAKLLAKEFTQKEFEDLMCNNADVRIYDTMADFSKDFNNRKISDLGYMCVVTIKN